jgi:hypothetical protein
VLGARVAARGGNVVAGAAAGVLRVLVVQVMRGINPVGGSGFFSARCYSGVATLPVWRVVV